MGATELREKIDVDRLNIVRILPVQMAPSQPSLETKFVRTEMIRRNWRTPDLAARCGIKSDSLANQWALNFSSRTCRHRVEAALNMRIWSSPDEWAARQKVKTMLGYDPALAQTLKLRSECQKRHVRRYYLAGSREDYIALLVQHAAQSTESISEKSV